MFLQLKVFEKVSVHIHVEDANTSNRKLVISLVSDGMVTENSTVSKDTTTTKKKRVSVDGSNDEKPPTQKSKGKASKKK